MKLLIIEDEKELSKNIKHYLELEDYICEQAYTFFEAIEKVENYSYDCVILDLMLPGGNGLDILRKLKEISPETGVIIASAKDSLTDKIEGLKIGADDYIAKPFHLPELSIRIFALMRRNHYIMTNHLENGNLKIDLLSKEVMANDQLIELTKSEYEMLIFLIKNHKRVISKSAIAEHLSGDMADMMDDFNFVYAHIKNLKSKLASVGMKNCIRTIYGVGYKWEINQ